LEAPSIHTTRRANVVGFDHEAELKQNLQMVSAITATELPYELSVLLMVHEA
jgi:hypothetical protein